MKTWLTGARGTVLMILTWIVGWGLGFGGLMELYDPSGRIEDVWPTALAIPGFIGGIVFCTLFRIAEAPRGFHEVPLGRAATWGVVTGLALGVLGIAAGVGSDPPRAVVMMIGIAAALGAVAAFGSAVFFRILSRQIPALAGRMG